MGTNRGVQTRCAAYGRRNGRFGEATAAFGHRGLEYVSRAAAAGLRLRPIPAGERQFRRRSVDRHAAVENSALRPAQRVAELADRDGAGRHAAVHGADGRVGLECLADRARCRSSALGAGRGPAAADAVGRLHPQRHVPGYVAHSDGEYVAVFPGRADRRLAALCLRTPVTSALPWRVRLFQPANGSC